MDNIIHVIDFKTGKVRPGTYDEQLELYGLAIHSIYDVGTVIPELWFLDSGENIIGDNFIQSCYESVKKKWVKKINAMENTKTFKAKPSWLCNYCYYSSKKGGQCEY